MQLTVVASGIHPWAERFLQRLAYSGVRICGGPFCRDVDLTPNHARQYGWIGRVGDKIVKLTVSPNKPQPGWDVIIGSSHNVKCLVVALANGEMFVYTGASKREIYRQAEAGLLKLLESWA